MKNTGDNINGWKIPSLFLQKYWFWFEEPREIAGADLAAFFSYVKISAPGFKRKEGLTTVIDLNQPEEIISGKMRKNFIRKQIERGQRNGIKAVRDENFSGFKKIYLGFRRGKNIHSENFSFIEKYGELFSAYLDGGMIAGGVFIARNRQARAWVLASKRLAGADGKARDLIGQANRMVIWEAIKHYRSAGFEILDLGGINPDSPDPSQRSLSEFKEAFGGERRSGYFYYRIYSPILRLIKKWREKI